MRPPGAGLASRIDALLAAGLDDDDGDDDGDDEGDAGGDAAPEHGDGDELATGVRTLPLDRVSDGDDDTELAAADPEEPDELATGVRPAAPPPPPPPGAVAAVAATADDAEVIEPSDVVELAPEESEVVDADVADSAPVEVRVRPPVPPIIPPGARPGSVRPPLPPVPPRIPPAPPRIPPAPPRIPAPPGLQGLPGVAARPTVHVPPVASPPPVARVPVPAPVRGEGSDAGLTIDLGDEPDESRAAPEVIPSLRPRRASALVALSNDDASGADADGADGEVVELTGITDVVAEPEGEAPGAAPAPERVPGPAPERVPDRVPEPVVEAALETHLEAPTAVERALADLGEAAHERRAAELARAVDATTDRPTVAALAYELGELCERRLADEARAVKAFGKALASDPSLRPNLWAIRRIFYRRGLWPNLMKLLDAEQRFARSDAERADLLVEKGLLLRDRLDQPAEARAALEEASRLDPRSPVPLIALERLAIAEGDLGRAAGLWAQLAAVSRTPQRKLTFLLDLARFHGERGGAEELARARAALDEAAALGLQPVEVERVAQERLRLAEQRVDAAGVGGPDADAARDELLGALDGMAAVVWAQGGPAGPPQTPALTAGVGLPLDRAALLRLRVVAIRRRQAQLARAAGQAERAWDYLQQALALAPGRPLLIADLADVAEELGRFEELAELVESWQALEGDPSRALTLSLRRADALLRGGQRDAARAVLASLEASAPGLLPLVALVERDAVTSQDWAALAAAWGRAADAARLGALLDPSPSSSDGGPGGGAPDPALAAAWYVAAAEVWAHDVGAQLEPDGHGNPADVEARACLGKALEVVRGYPPAIEALVDLHERLGRVDDAAAVLELQADSGDVDHRVQILARLARLYRDHGMLDQALGAELRLRRLLPDDVRLMWQVDVTLSQLGRGEERIQNLQAIAGRDPDPARKGVALATAARLAEDVGDRDRAIELYRQVLGVWPADRYARAALVELLRAQERWEELVAQRRAEATELSDGPGVVRALREAAWVLEDRLGRPADAAEVWRALLDRVPDEPVALDGLIRCLTAAGDNVGLVAALEARLEAVAVDTGASAGSIAGAAVALALAHEQAGRVDDAIDAYRRAIALAERLGAPAADAAPGAGVAVALAALAVADVAAERGDPAARLDAYAALRALGATDPGAARLAAALDEDLGWLHALVLEDYDRAAAAFAAAAAADPARRGPWLGALLVAGRRGDVAAQIDATSALARASSMPEASAALHLRAAALRTAAAETTAASVEVARARAIAPDDVGALVVAAEYAPSSSGVDGMAAADVQGAIDQLLARAEVFGLRGALTDDPVARASWELDRAEALEAAGRLREAGGVVASVLRTLPGDFRALEALRRLARRGGDAATLARATVALARRMGDPAGRVELLREAAALLDPNVAATPGAPGVDADAAVGVYRRILADDAGAPEFDRLVALYRQAGDVRGLHLAIDDRLAWIARGGAEPGFAVPLLVERARLKHGLGDARGALADLDDVYARDPDHAVALRFGAELATALGLGARAVELYRRYLAVEADASQREIADLALARVLAEDVGDAAGAIAQLERMIAQRPDDPTLRERVISLATGAGDPARVARELRELARLRVSPGDKAREELRLAAVQRDQLGDRGAARETLRRARAHDPLNLEIIAQLVALTDEAAARTRLLAEIADEVRAAIAQAPARAPLHERLATLAGWQRDRDTEYWATLAVEALGSPTSEQRKLLSDGRRATPPLSRHLLDAAARDQLRPAAATGTPLGDVWRACTAAVTAAHGLDAARLGVGRGDRVAIKELGKRKLDALAAVLGSFGLEEVELYVSDQRAGLARVLGGEVPVICLGADVAAGATASARFWLGRVAMLAAEGTGTLAELKDAEVASFLVAAARAVDAAVPPGLADVAADGAAAIAERVRLLGKHLARRDKKALAQLAPQLGRVGGVADLAAWRRGCLAAANRAGLLCAGDLAPALAALDVSGARAIADAPLAVDLVAWAVSTAHLELRRRLGYALGGGS